MTTFNLNCILIPLYFEDKFLSQNLVSTCVKFVAFKFLITFLTLHQKSINYKWIKTTFYMLKLMNSLKSFMTKLNKLLLSKLKNNRVSKLKKIQKTVRPRKLCLVRLLSQRISLLISVTTMSLNLNWSQDRSYTQHPSKIGANVRMQLTSFMVLNEASKIFKMILLKKNSRINDKRLMIHGSLNLTRQNLLKTQSLFEIPREFHVKFLHNLFKSI